ncbi:hypothetical protein [Cryptosporangium phraense]|uniref:hypothetical protein n=1 Tax=Cryptosporangium phraense TaxID=2593070 RepID=UPI00197A8254|nr:hypothetical protein [Cryptosporangium phraense]
MSTPAPTTVPASPDELRARLVDSLLSKDDGWAGLTAAARVEQALREVLRHAFVLEASLEEAYADDTVITKRAADGTPLSCASAPYIVTSWR